MRIHLIAVGQRMPGWVEQGYGEFAKRLGRDCPLVLHEIAPGKRGKGLDSVRAMRDEGERLLAAIPREAEVIALDVRGRSLSTPDLAHELARWQQGGRDIALLVGGADGLAPEVSARAQSAWSLSALTFPHALVRVLIAEQLYRAWSLNHGHPYHRE